MIPVSYILVFAGGGAGALARFIMTSFVSHKVSGDFPWPTLAINLLGAFAIGLLTELLALKFSLSAQIRYLLVTGFLGGFTTFSAFTLESMMLMQRGQHALLLIYVCASVVGSMMLFWAATTLIRAIF